MKKLLNHHKFLCLFISIFAAASSIFGSCNTLSLEIAKECQVKIEALKKNNYISTIDSPRVDTAVLVSDSLVEPSVKQNDSESSFSNTPLQVAAFKQVVSIISINMEKEMLSIQDGGLPVVNEIATNNSSGFLNPLSSLLFNEGSSRLTKDIKEKINQFVVNRLKENDALKLLLNINRESADNIENEKDALVLKRTSKVRNYILRKMGKDFNLQRIELTENGESK